MVLLESLHMPLGMTMPNFEATDPHGQSHTLTQCLGPKGLLIVFTCNHCPYAIAIWERVISLSHWAKEKGIHTVAINPNINPDYPDDSPEAMAHKIEEWGIPFPYLVDETQSIAKAYDAQCTPDLYLLNGEKELIYHGRLDDNWQQPENVHKEELREAMIAYLNGQDIPQPQYPSMGCSIKWL